MISIEIEELPRTIANESVDVRTSDVGELTVSYIRLQKGTDLSPALVGLPHNLCPCPHWGYMLKGRVLMKTTNGDQIFEAGKPFYWGPGHAPVALEDSEYIDFSPTEQFAAVIRHIKGE